MLRVVRRLQKQLPLSDEADDATGALGDWYVTRFVVQRRPYIMLASSTSLLACIERAQNVRNLPSRLPDIVASRLDRLGIGSAVIDAEIAAMQPVVTGPTIDRSVTGAMVDYCKLVGYRGDDGPGELEIESEETFLWRTPMLTSRRGNASFFPERRGRELLDQRWSNPR